MPNIIEQIRSTYATEDNAARLVQLQELFLEYDEGRLQYLPCQIGDTVYCIDKDNAVKRCMVIRFEITEWEKYYWLCLNEPGQVVLYWQKVSAADFNKVVFLSCAAAEATLKKRKKK